MCSAFFADLFTHLYVNDIIKNLIFRIKHKTIIVMQEASNALSKTADSDTISTYQVFSVQLMTDKKLEAFNKA